MSSSFDFVKAPSYDDFADEYINTETSALRVYVEKPTVFGVLGNIHHKSILDLACGVGKYTRAVKSLGAAHTVGIDISEGMIAQARMMEARQPLGIQYLVKDVATLNQVGSFDVVTAVYLFPYAQTRQSLEAMARATFINLKPGGRLVTLVPNPELSQSHYLAVRKHGVLAQIPWSLVDGTPIEITLRYNTQTEDIRIINHYWSEATYEQVLRKVGFKQITWHPMRVSDEGVKLFGWDYWREYLLAPHTAVIECYK